MVNLVKLSSSLFLSILLSGCASSLMRPAPEGQPTPTLGPGEAQIIFMRPSSFGGAVQATVYDVTESPDKFIGVSSSKTKIRFITKPGKRLFMVVGESADFMAAQLVEGKTYYALVTPRVGLWKARFSLKPVRRAQRETDEFRGWVDGARFVENTPESEQWARDNWGSIQGKKSQYLPKWEAKSEGDKQARTLNKADGI